MGRSESFGDEPGGRIRCRLKGEGARGQLRDSRPERTGAGMMPAAVVGGRLLGVTRGAAPLPPRLHFETVLEGGDCSVHLQGSKGDVGASTLPSGPELTGGSIGT